MKPIQNALRLSYWQGGPKLLLVLPMPMPRFAIMNLALLGIEADFGKENADTATRVSAKP